MHATTTFEPRTTTSQATAQEAGARRVRASDELYDFRRYNYADGWDSDDAALGWIDESLVTRDTRRVH
jgi:hypothetical protein